LNEFKVRNLNLNIKSSRHYIKCEKGNFNIDFAGVSVRRIGDKMTLTGPVIDNPHIGFDPFAINGRLSMCVDRDERQIRRSYVARPEVNQSAEAASTLLLRQNSVVPENHQNDEKINKGIAPIIKFRHDR
jgi:hypothetical protein